MDVLSCVNRYQGMLQVAWSEGEHSREVIKPYDWTYATDYKGTLLGESLKLKVVPTRTSYRYRATESQRADSVFRRSSV